MPNQLPGDVEQPPGWTTHFRPAERLGYSGVALYARHAPDAVDVLLGDEEMDAEGRVQIAEFGEWLIANVYFPNGSGKDRDNSRIPFKLAFYERLRTQLEARAEGKRPVLVMGDWNTAHRAIDLARPKSNEKTSGFCPEERAALDVWERAGWTDTYRHLHPDKVEYSWWSQRRGVREKNIGWRIDAIWANGPALERVTGAGIDVEVTGSDHAPIWVEVDASFPTNTP